MSKAGSIYEEEVRVQARLPPTPCIGSFWIGNSNTSSQQMGSALMTKFGVRFEYVLLDSWPASPPFLAP